MLVMSPCLLAKSLAYKSLTIALDCVLTNANKAKVESCYSIPDIGKLGVPKAPGSALVNRKSKGLEREESSLGVGRGGGRGAVSYGAETGAKGTGPNTCEPFL